MDVCFTGNTIIMEVENGCTWKVTTIGGTHFSLPWLWEEGEKLPQNSTKTRVLKEVPFIFVEHMYGYVWYIHLHSPKNIKCRYIYDIHWAFGYTYIIYIYIYLYTYIYPLTSLDLSLRNSLHLAPGHRAASSSRSRTSKSIVQCPSNGSGCRAGTPRVETGGRIGGTRDPETDVFAPQKWMVGRWISLLGWLMFRGELLVSRRVTPMKYCLGGIHPCLVVVSNTFYLLPDTWGDDPFWLVFFNPIFNRRCCTSSKGPFSVAMLVY